MVAVDWNDLFTRHEALGCSLARGIVRDLDLARDVFQDAARAVIERARSGGIVFESNEHARNYLLAIVRNLAIDARNRPRPSGPAPEPVAPDLGPDAIAERRDHAAAVTAAMDDLRPDEREVLALRFRDGLTFREIAARTRTSISTLQARVTTALQKIRERVGK